MQTQFTTIGEAINWIADVLQLGTEGAQWVYDNTGCPDWDDEAFTKYDFLADPATGKIPEELA